MAANPLPDEGIQRAAIVILELSFIAMFASLLWQTMSASSPVQPPAAIGILTPVFAGALGLLLARSLGVEPAVATAASRVERVRAIFVSTPTLLRLGAWIYLLAGVAGGIVWALKGSVTPELVTVLVLTAAGYLAATVTSFAQP